MRNGTEGTRGGVGTFEGYADEAIAHFADEMVGGEGEFKEE